MYRETAVYENRMYSGGKAAPSEWLHLRARHQIRHKVIIYFTLYSANNVIPVKSAFPLFRNS